MRLSYRVSSVTSMALILTIVPSLLLAATEGPANGDWGAAENPLDSPSSINNEAKPVWVESPAVAAEIDRLEVKYPEKEGKTKWGPTGHQYTTFIVAKAAGLGPTRSHRLAFYSQYPDDEKEFSATLAFFRIDDLEYRKQIMATLHSLHGGDHDAVLDRRADLERLLSATIKEDTKEQDVQSGLIIHALGDAYSHTKGDLADGDLQAFGYVWGHLFHGHEPDLIAYNPEKYKAFACALHRALAADRSCEKALGDLLALVDKLREGRGEALPEFQKLAKHSYGYDQHKYEEELQVNPPVNKDDVLKTIGLIQAEFDR